MKLLFISVWSTRIDLRNETFILNIGEEIPIKITQLTNYEIKNLRAKVLKDTKKILRLTFSASSGDMTICKAKEPGNEKEISFKQIH